MTANILDDFVVRNGFAHFVRKVFAHRKLLPGKFWDFAPLPNSTLPPLTPIQARPLQNDTRLLPSYEEAIDME